MDRTKATPGVDPDEIVAALSPSWLAGTDGAARTEVTALLRQLADDWVREASGTPDPAAVVRIQLRDFGAPQPGGDPGARLTTLRAEVTRREVDRLDAATFALGKAVIDGTVDSDRAGDEGKGLLERAEALAEQVKALPADMTAALRRALGDAMMEALFAAEGKAMSGRLERYRSSVDPGGGGPPSVSPAPHGPPAK